MRPDRKPYIDALRQVRATIEARKRKAEGGMTKPEDGMRS
jgi:hypothetical protein